MVIAGGPATLLGPIVGAALVVVVKNVVSGYIERWNFLLGAIFVAIVILMPEGLVPGTVRLWRQGWRAFGRRRSIVIAGSAEPQAMSRAHRQQALQGVRRPARHHRRQSQRRAGRTAADHRPERRRQDHAVQPDHRRAHAGQRLDPPARPGHHRRAEPPPRRISAWRAPIRSSRCLPATPSSATSRWRCSAFRRRDGIR